MTWFVFFFRNTLERFYNARNEFQIDLSFVYYENLQTFKEISLVRNQVKKTMYIAMLAVFVIIFFENFEAIHGRN